MRGAASAASVGRLGGEGAVPAEHGPMGSSPAGGKRRAQEDPEGERANVYQCTDDLDACPAHDIPLMKLAKEIVGQASIERHDETVASKEVMKHPGPIIHRHEITNKESSGKMWD